MLDAEPKPPTTKLYSEAKLKAATLEHCLEWYRWRWGDTNVGWLDYRAELEAWAQRGAVVEEQAQKLRDKLKTMLARVWDFTDDHLGVETPAVQDLVAFRRNLCTSARVEEDELPGPGWEEWDNKRLFCDEVAFAGASYAGPVVAPSRLMWLRDKWPLLVSAGAVRERDELKARGPMREQLMHELSRYTILAGFWQLGADIDRALRKGDGASVAEVLAHERHALSSTIESFLRPVGQKAKH